MVVKSLVVASGMILCSSMALSSNEVRSKKHGEVTLQPVGFHMFPFLGYGAGASYYLRPDLSIGVEYTTAEAKLDGVKFSAVSYGLKAKYFLLDSFYLGAGFSQRKFGISGEQEFKDKSEKVVIKSKIDLEVSGSNLDFFVGNQWYLFDFMTIGCDWIGVSVPIQAKSSDNLPVTAKDTDDYKEFKDTLEWAKKKPSYILTKFYVGMTF